MSKVRVEWVEGDTHYHMEARIKESRKGNSFFEACGPYGTTRVFVVKEDDTIISKPKKNGSRGGWEAAGRVIQTLSGTVYFIGAGDELCLFEKQGKGFVTVECPCCDWTYEGPQWWTNEELKKHQGLVHPDIFPELVPEAKAS